MGKSGPPRALNKIEIKETKKGIASREEKASSLYRGGKKKGNSPEGNESSKREGKEKGPQRGKAR